MTRMGSQPTKLSRRTVLSTVAATPVLATGMQQGPAARAEHVSFPTVVLPESRILSYYGFPGNELMGILGEYSMEDLLPILQEQAAAYEAADPSRPVVLAYEVIASVAQRDPMEDGSYIARIDDETLDAYAEFCEQNGLLLILDLQFGRLSVEDELNAIKPWLKLPHVHPALDPEFAIKEGETPGEDLGGIDADDVERAMEWLLRVQRQNDLPPKILVVHQFHWYSISNKERIQPVDGLQFVLEVDGWGPPDDKRETYRVLTENPIEYHGFKLWYRQDEPLMTPEEVVALDPSPDIVIYQ